MTASVFTLSHLARVGVDDNALEAAQADLGEVQWNEIIVDLDSFGKLQDDWDGQGAKAPSPTLWKSAVELAHTLRSLNYDPPSGVFSGPNGTILLEWQDQSIYFHVEISKPFYAKWMQVIPGQSAKHGNLQLGLAIRPVSNMQWVPDSFIDAQMMTIQPALS